MSEDERIWRSIKRWITGGIFLGIALIGGCMWGQPQYNVWEQGLVGEAALAKATQDRQIRVQEAEADKAAAKLEGEAEVARATGVAEANKIMADSLGGPEGYLRWRFILALEKNQSAGKIIYVPTEAGLPILEANRLRSSAPSFGLWKRE